MSRTLHGNRSILPLLFMLSACQPPGSTAPIGETAAGSASPSPTWTPLSSPLPPVVTATLPPAPRFFQEDFDRGAPYWTFIQTVVGIGPLTVGTDRGFLGLSLSMPNQSVYALYGSEVYADVRIDARVEFAAGGRGAAGLICRYDQAAGWYEFNIYADRTYNLLFGQWLAPGIVRYTPLVIAESEKITPTVNEIGLACQDDILTPYINGVQLRRRQETLHILHTGWIGASAASFESAPLLISVDWLKVGNP